MFFPIQNLRSQISVSAILSLLGGDVCLKMLTQLNGCPFDGRFLWVSKHVIPLELRFDSLPKILFVVLLQGILLRAMSNSLNMKKYSWP